MDQNAILVYKLLASLPHKYKDEHLEFLYRQGYLIGIISALMADDFNAEMMVKRKIHEQRKK